MEHIAALLLVVGCLKDLGGCHELPPPVAVFETMDECVAERPFALGDLAGAADHVVGACLPVDPALEDDYNQLVWNVRSDGSLDASLGISNLMVASNGQRPEKDDVSQQ